MKKKGATLMPLSPAHLAGIASFQVSIILLMFFGVLIATLPLIIFLFLCAVAPFLPRFSFFLPIVYRGDKKTHGIAVTFDDGPDPAVTPLVLDLLKGEGAAATFFLAGKKAEENPLLVAEILSRGHAIGNHSYSHDPFLMLRNSNTLYDEVARAQRVFEEFGITPMAFRPPVGITNPRLWRVLLRAGMFCCTFSCRAFDRGNRRVKNISKTILRKIKPGDILLLHDVCPAGASSIHELMCEFEKIFAGLKDKNLKILPLSEVIGRPVMMKSKKVIVSGPVSAFYDMLASGYDREQDGPGSTPVRAKELELFSNRFLGMVTKSDRVLEIGGGTGRFTIPIAAACSEIVVLDVSENMISHVIAKSSAGGIENIVPMVHDFMDADIVPGFDVVCAFSSFEYMPDIESVLKKIYTLLLPGGTLYFITSHSSLFRFFVQVGNAMRQGLWLHARSTIKMRKMLKRNGFSCIKIHTHVFKSLISGGMIMEVHAKRE